MNTAVFPAVPSFTVTLLMLSEGTPAPRALPFKHIVGGHVRPRRSPAHPLNPNVTDPFPDMVEFYPALVITY